MGFTVFAGGTLFDGTGAAPSPGDVLIEGSRIVATGKGLEFPPDAAMVDCRGLAVAPGFIDLHSHSDLQVLENRREKTLQGVTTEVVGNCGFSPYPCRGNAVDVREFSNGIFRGGDEWKFDGVADYMQALGQTPRLVSVQSLVGHGSLRVALFGPRQDALSAGEMDALDGELTDALSGGAAGLSTGLMYAPGSSAPFDELARLCRRVARTGKLYATHMRSYSFELLEAVEEQLELARETGCRLQISHLQAVGRVNWDKQRRALDLLESARERDGVDVEFDIYPYQAGSTVLTQFMPQWALDGGTAALLRRLSDAGDRRRIAEEAVAGMAQQWSDVFIASVDSTVNQALVGLHLEEIGRRRGVDPVDAAIQLIVDEQGAVNIVSFNQSEENLRGLLTHPLCSVISDGFYVKGRPHPRLHGTFPFLLGEISRTRGWMPLEQAIHKITMKPATRLGLGDRGRLASGMQADITVFDPRRIAGPATYERPEQAPCGLIAVYREGENVLPVRG